ncbi:transcriptional corepressor LEUNIG-like [Dorcoceras hygrometricum]|uniref:Transcriptional corepressor LEUNIG-like n=1 Tax=Dorcoceras hygrometricum TaxID=472368 RepID=A0A2Z7BVQ8_9LAMI|nr:transcriptional corepressor LEUNIG-like [Dorcoceras hygrometricum]
MVIGSPATLDLPMIVDLIGIFMFKGPYCTLTMTDLFLQALSVIPRGSWGDVSRRFTMIRWLIFFFPFLSFPVAVAAADFARGKSHSDRSDEEIPSVKYSSSFLVQTSEGIGIPVVDRIRRPKPPTVEVPIPREIGRSQTPRRQQGTGEINSNLAVKGTIVC